MTTFDERDRGFENKFAHDEELTFKAHARRNKLIGLWAAEKLGKTGDAAAHYAEDLILIEFDSTGPHDVIEKLLQDFKKAGIAMTAQDIQREMEQLMALARRQLTEA